jgi:hypothetical protein
VTEQFILGPRFRFLVVKDAVIMYMIYRPLVESLEIWVGIPHVNVVNRLRTRDLSLMAHASPWFHIGVFYAGNRSLFWNFFRLVPEYCATL